MRTGRDRLGDFAPDFARYNGVTKEEMAEIITQLGFYTGWPKAWAAFNMAKEVYGKQE